MTVRAAPGDTWGIAGPEFLIGYIVLAVVVIWLSIVMRRAVLTPAANNAHYGDLDAFALSMLADGPIRTIHAALAGLRARQLIKAKSKKDGIDVTGLAGAGLHPVEWAVYQAIAAGRNRPVKILTEPGVRAALTGIRGQLEQAGLMLTGAQRASYRLRGLLLVPVLALGMLRFWAGATYGKPILYLPLLLTVLVVLQLVFLLGGAPARTKAGDAEIHRAAQRHDHLAPSLNPSWAAYGATGAAMGVAVFGAGALIAADPAFAAEAQIRQFTSSSGDSSSSSSSCSSGSSCSSSSCGGGGCGG